MHTRSRRKNPLNALLLITVLLAALSLFQLNGHRVLAQDENDTRIGLVQVVDGLVAPSILTPMDRGVCMSSIVLA